MTDPATWLPDQPFFRVAEVAKLLDCSPSKVLRWANGGELGHVRLGAQRGEPGAGHLRIPREELAKFLAVRSNVGAAA